MIKKNLLGAVLMVLFLAGTSYAQDSADQGNSPQDQGAGAENPHHTPPQAAIDACSGKSEGDACDYTNSKGEDKSGTCANTSDQQLFCKRSKQSSS
jgi:hypothetical protein